MSRAEEDEEVPSSNPGPGLEQPRPQSPTMSHLSERSKDSPLAFSSETKTEKTDSSTQTPVETRPRRNSHKARRKSSILETEPEKFPDQPRAPSDNKHSQDSPKSFAQQETSEITADRSAPSAVSAVSLKSGFSKDVPMHFKKDTLEITADRSDPSAVSAVSFKSDFSKDVPMHFKKDTLEDYSDAFTGGETNIDSVFEAVEKSVHEFVQRELKTFQKIVASDFMECFKMKSAGEQLDEWKKPREAVLNITLHFLRQMKQEQVADSLMNRLLALVCQCQLKSNLKTRFQNVFEGIRKTEEPTPLNEVYTELYLTEGGSSDISEKHEVTQIEMRPTRPPTTLNCEDIFRASPGRQKTIRAELKEGQGPIRAELKEGQGPIRTELKEGQGPIRTELTEGQGPIRAELKEGQGPIRTELTEGQGPIRAELKEGQGPIRAELKEGQGPIRTELTEGQGPIRTELTEGQGPIRTELTEGQGPIRTELTEGQRPIRTELTEGQGPIRTELTEGQGPIRTELTEGQGPIRTVVTKGVAGIGKTVLTQKFSLDWAEGGANQDFHFIFPFTFRELNLLKEESISLVGLVGYVFAETNPSICRFEEFQTVFIFDGLDECRLELDFTKTPSVSDVREKTSVDVLLVNLIRGTLLPSAHIWITTRPAAANQIPAEFVGMVTEVRGFTDPQKEIYFNKKFRDKERASKIISHVKASRSIHSMCYIPVFCWITAKVFDDVLQTGDAKQLPQTLTELYIHFLVVQAKVANVKYKGKSEADPHWSPESREMIMSLSKLAFEQLQKGNLIFYESDLIDCGINIEEASVYSGVFTQMFKEEKGLYQNKVFSFVHLSVQEFLAALHVHLSFTVSGVNLVSTKQSLWLKLFGGTSLLEFYQTAVDKALESPNGHLDLFLQFLLGLSLDCNQSLLRGLMKQTESSQINQETVQYLKDKLNTGLSVEKNLTLLHCLNELKDTGLSEEVQTWLNSKKLPSDLSPAQWSALACILLSSEQDLDLFDLQKYQRSETALLMLLPVIKASNKALLSGCGLSDRSCEALVSVLSSQCSLRELDLNNNNLQDSGVNLLCTGLKSPHCALQTLRLNFCSLSGLCCESLASVLDSEVSSLTELDLSNNDIEDSGVNALCTGLRSSHCKLERLRLSGCQVTKVGCASLVSALSSGSSCVEELDLSYNHPGAKGRKQLTALSEDPQRRLKTLRLGSGGEERIKPGFRKYAYDLTLDPNSANKRIKLSNNNRRITVEKEKQPYPDHSERFDYWKQIVCTEGLTGRRYWEVDCTGDVYIAVTYKSIKRRGTGDESCFGRNAQSWSLGCSEEKYSVLHKNRRSFLRVKPSTRVGVYLDWDNGVLSFYCLCSDKNILLHTYKTSFTQPVYPAFRVKTEPFNSSVTLRTRSGEG